MQDSIDGLLLSVIDDFDSFTDEYKAECREKTKSFLISLINESESLEQLRAKVEAM